MRKPDEQWLRERQYAVAEDDQRLETFLKRLGHRDTALPHLAMATCH